MQPSLNKPPMSGDETTPAPGATLPPLSPELPARDAEAAAPITEAPPKDKADAGRILLPKALVDDLYREARKNFALIPDMTFALAAGSRALRDIWEHKDGKFIRKERPFANYIPPKDDESGATFAKPQTDAESPDVAAARARWDEAKRESDPDRMTRTANDLLRAVETEYQGWEGSGRKSPSAEEVLSPRNQAPILPSDAFEHGVREGGLAAPSASGAVHKGALTDRTAFSERDISAAAAIIDGTPPQQRPRLIAAFGRRFGNDEAVRLKQQLRNPPHEEGAPRLRTLELDDSDPSSNAQHQQANFLEDFWNWFWDSRAERPWESAPQAPWFESRVEQTNRRWGNQAYFRVNDREFSIMNSPQQATIVNGANFLIGTFAGEGTDPVYSNPGRSYIVGVRRYGSFRNDENGQGLILLDENGQDVTFRGKPRVFTWDELYAYGKLWQRLSESQGLRDFFGHLQQQALRKPEVQFAAGIYDAAKELARLPEDLFGVEPGQRFVDRFLLEIPRDNSLAGNVVRDLGRFLAGFVPIARGMQVAGWTLKGVRGLTNAVAAGALTDFLTAPTDGERPVNTLWRALGLPETALNEYLDGRATDGGLEARVKNAVNGGVLTAASAAVITVLARATRAALRAVFRPVEDAVEKATEMPFGFQYYPETLPEVAPYSGRPMGPGQTLPEVEFRAAQKNWSLHDQFSRAPANQRQLFEWARALTRKRNDAEFINPGVKEWKSASEKQTRYRWQDASRFTDIVRGGFIVQRPEAADEIVAALNRRYDIIDKGWVRQESGHIDRKILVRFDDGQVGEIQFWSPRLYKAAKRTHPLYQQLRGLNPGAPDYDQRIAALNAQSRTIVDDEMTGEAAAWRRFLDRELQQESVPRYLPKRLR